MGHTLGQTQQFIYQEKNTSQVNLEPESLDDIKIPFI